MAIFFQLSKKKYTERHFKVIQRKKSKQLEFSKQIISIEGGLLMVGKRV